MGIKRIVDTSFWTDGKVDEFSPEDKYFMLYLLTNPATTQLGIYEMNIKRSAYELGYSVDAVKVLLERFENKYGIILYSQETKEIAIKNFLRHSIVKGGFAVWDCLIKEIRAVKDKSLVSEVFSHIQKLDDLNNTVRDLIADYEKGNIRFYKEWNEARANEIENEKENEIENDNDNDNENDNDVSYPVSGYESVNNQNQHQKIKQNAQNSQEAVENSVENSDDEVILFKDRVYLSENQISELIDEMGIIVFDIYVDRLNAFIKEKNAKLKNHFEIIRKWYREDLP